MENNSKMSCSGKVTGSTGKSYFVTEREMPLDFKERFNSLLYIPAGQSGILNYKDGNQIFLNSEEQS